MPYIYRKKAASFKVEYSLQKSEATCSIEVC